mmetsp:Transcript_11652/g.24576  ORF Transcript_11652/g.24576 Transcript_11652/m.24576 type:complete len:209 (-) Transcript_11652:72-698(-)
MAANNDPPTNNIVVIFGRPGSGKSTVAEAAMKLMAASSCNSGLDTTALDLDVCVPQWMKDNFAKGIYPTLQQRKEFASTACDYVDCELAKATRPTAAIVSFSFVNIDLRDTFRQRFPAAKWVLIDVTDQIANERLEAREGHFYKGAPTRKSKEDTKERNRAAAEKHNGEDNSEWEFAAVTYPHVVLDGRMDVDINAQRVVETLNSTTR